MAKTGKVFTNIGLAQASDFPIVVRNIKEGKSGTFLRGAPVLFAGGYLDECGASPTSLFGFANQAGSDTAADGTNTLQILKAIPGVEFSGTLNTTSLAQTMQGVVMALVLSSTTWVLATTSATSDGQCLITGWDSTWSEGDDYPVVNFTVVPEMIQVDQV
jgi:hypothetical protein